MGRWLVPIAIVQSIAAFAVAAVAAALAAVRPGWWGAAVALAVLGGIVPMIMAVNIRVVPVFAGRSWPGEASLRAEVALIAAGAWTVFAGRLAGWGAAETAGSAAALAGGLIFVGNSVRLFRRPKEARPAPPLPVAEQAAVDRLATRFTRLSGVYLLLGLAVGLLLSVWRPPFGRWDLVWAHTLLVGAFMPMASGICYHVLARWTGRPWRTVPLIRLHLWLVAAGLPPMLVALALDRTALFAVAGTAQAVAIALFLAAIAPMLPGLPQPTRAAFVGAAALLLVGIGFGALFALDPAAGARLRTVHAEINLFGWTGLLVSGVGYYLFPRFAGRPLRWPRLAPLQLALLGGGVTLAASAGGWRAFAASDPLTAAAGMGMGLAALGFALFAALVAGTFFGGARGKTGTAAPLVLAKPTGAGRPR